jgi:diaminohydroxyphosphoribosylaminopyrimidine deaminase/5-amino-6-(5-phosphoribosylamino)uracil reductase
MRRAHELAQRGWGRTFPNPMVGAVLVADGKIVGEGWHAEHGGRHAEVVAIDDAGARAKGATLYVTLEPCTHVGKQPPCTDAIIAAGIARVVIAVRDPNPTAAGGIERLRAAGVDAELDPDASAAYNFRFSHQFAGAMRPYVAVKLAVSMDAMIADSDGKSQWISSPAAREWVHWLRAGFGAIGVGARTAMADDVQLTVRGSVSPRVAPVRVIFDRHGALATNGRLFGGMVPVTVVVGSGVAGAAREAFTRAGAQVVVGDELADALEALSVGGVDSILIEGGGRLASALLREGLVDRVYQVQAPRWLGTGVPAWPAIPAVPLAASERWRMVAVERLGDCDDADAVLTLDRR